MEPDTKPSHATVPLKHRYRTKILGFHSQFSLTALVSIFISVLVYSFSCPFCQDVNWFPIAQRFLLFLASIRKDILDISIISMINNFFAYCLDYDNLAKAIC